MVKNVLLLAIAANAILLVLTSEPCSSDKGCRHRLKSSISSSSSSSRSSYSSASSSSSATSVGSVSSPFHHPHHKQCRPNERWVQCPEAVCEPKSCTDIGFPIRCYNLQRNGRCPGKPACICEEGYVRNSQGVCIPSGQCPSCKGDPNQVAGCGVYCNQRCRDIGQEPGACILVCYSNSCNCREGFYLDENTGNCVLPNECTPQCPNNEVYTSCIQGNCGPQNCTQLGAPLSCPRIDPRFCKTGCICRDGYVRNEEGYCIPSVDCPSCGGDPNAQAGCGTNCNKRCSDIGNEPGACIASCNLNGCDCKEGYYLDSNSNACVKPEECTPQCPVNEFYSTCVQGNCSPQSCSQLGSPIACPRIDPGYCKTGCLCQEGYVRNDDGLCIPTSDCQSCNGDPNAKPGCGTYCNKRCSDIGREPGACIEICNLNSCDCKDGYYLDSNTNQCVKPEQCTPQCPANEFYSDCVQGNCSPQSCSQLGSPIACPRIDPGYCTKGCLCQQGFVRNDDGLCVPSSDCPSCKGDPNQVAGCGVYCNQRCSDIGKEPGGCILICYPNSCDCREGFYLDENTGNCVRPDQCTPQCPANEFYSDCVQGNCSPQSCSQLGLPIACPRIDPRYCKKGCLCQQGFVRNGDGICVPSSDCPSCKGDPNQRAGCGVYCNQKCSDIGKEPRGCIRICYPNSCDCREGFYLDENTGNCVRPDQCTSQCPINEVYSNCLQGNCGPKSCTQLGQPISCPRIDPRFCKKGCTCKDGYVRNYEGICIPSIDCPSCGGDPNAQAGCGTNCNKRCTDIGNEPGFCPAICNLNGCDCKDGYYLNSNNKCVKPEDCNPQCPPNEWYSECIQGNCGPQNCTQLGFPVPCAAISDSSFCKKGCLCKEGFLRNGNGYCVPSSECPSCGDDPNAVAGCGVNCNRHCSDIGKEPGACAAVCNYNACDCKEGLYYDDNTKRCVEPENCTQTCGINEEYNECSNANCDAETCDDLGFPVPCVDIDPSNCIKGCQCKPGYVKNNQGVCIPSLECPSCGGDPNAKPGCGGYCDRRCSDIGKEPRPCILICQVNGCDCKDGCVYDDNTKRCVKPEQCSTGPVCLESNNEVYSDCINGGCQAKNCSQYNKPVPCPRIDPKYCIKGCLCKEGYLRASNGQCVPERSCPEACTGANEEYNECSYDCPPQTCDSLDRQYGCPLMSKSNCKPMCKCKSGYFRNKIGECISEEQCRRCTGPYEYYSCGGACDNVCETLDQQSQDNCPIINVKCNEMCYCERGYARDKNNTCIPISSCDVSCGGDPNARPGCGVNCGKNCADLGKEVACIDICYDNGCDCKDGYYYDSNQKKCVLARECTGVCGTNEVYEDCTSPSCNAKNCTQLGFSLDCDSGCQKGCICKSGYVRDDNGRCIQINECPSCGGDPNAQSGCGGNCGKHCYNIGKGPGACSLACRLNGCDCRKGFYYDDNIKKCVKPEDCNKGPVCLKENNEVYSDCINGGCGLKNCSQYGKPVPCIKIDPKYCVKGCLCKEGYLRASNGKCIPQNSCPEACNGQNEEYVDCTFDCPPRTCESLDMSYVCPIREGEECKSMCRCKQGYYRNSVGLCITEEQCRMCSGPNEYYACGGACDNVCETLQQQNQTNCPIINIRCNDKCYCEEGYARNSNNICIPISSCNACAGDSNSEPGCGVNCLKKCHDLLNPNRPRICPRICNVDGCDCKKGYYLDENINKCVHPDECSRTCGVNEIYSSCVNGGCGRKNCSEFSRPQLCIDPIKCFGGCICKEGYLRLEDGTCVPIEQCPTPECNENERFSICPAKECQPQTCNDIGFPIECPSENATCPEQPGCVCDYGYVRDYEGVCRPKGECPSCGGDPHAKSGCGINCGKRCPNNNLNPKLCPRICLPNACDCKKNFYYDINTKTCVKFKNCSPRCDELNNEVYDSCVNGGCGWRNCSQVGGPQLCVDPIKCNQGCKCKEGYYRLDNGTCVPEEQCPLKCSGPNEYFSCGPACDNVCSRLHIESQERCPIKNVKCVSKCYCRKGFARNKRGVCIPIKKCPAPKTNKKSN